MNDNWFKFFPWTCISTERYVGSSVLSLHVSFEFDKMNDNYRIASFDFFFSILSIIMEFSLDMTEFFQSKISCQSIYIDSSGKSVILFECVIWFQWIRKKICYFVYVILINKNRVLTLIVAFFFSVLNMRVEYTKSPRLS